MVFVVLKIIGKKSYNLEHLITPLSSSEDSKMRNLHITHTYIFMA